MFLIRMILIVHCFMAIQLPALAEGTDADPAIETESNDHSTNDGKGSENSGGEDDHKVTSIPESDPFCDAIIEPALEQRYLLKQQELKALLVSVNERIEVLSQRKREQEEWIRKREEFTKRATGNLVEIYANMKPEAAAARLSQLNLDLAASLLLAISPRQASAILNEMDEKTAATITGFMSASAREKDPT